MRSPSEAAIEAAAEASWEQEHFELMLWDIPPGREWKPRRWADLSAEDRAFQRRATIAGLRAAYAVDFAGLA